MENQIRLALLVIGVIVIFAIWWDGVKRQKPTKVKEKTDYTDRKFRFSKLANETDDSNLDEEVLFDNSDEDFDSTEDNQIVNHGEIVEEMEDLLIDEKFIEEIEQVNRDLEEPILPTTIEEKPNNTLIMFSLVAKNDAVFSGFKLLQVLLNNEFHFGKEKIFYFHEDNDESAKKLFSLAAATETGEFDLAKMADFSCKGLVLFMNTKEHEKPAEIFDLMVEIAEKLATELQADLKINRDESWNDENLAELYEKLI